MKNSHTIKDCSATVPTIGIVANKAKDDLVPSFLLHLIMPADCILTMPDRAGAMDNLGRCAKGGDFKAKLLWIRKVSAFYPESMS